MYIKVFKGRHTSLSYLVIQDLTLNGTGNPYIKNEKHEIVEVSESELFYAIDKLFKDKQNATIQRCEARDTEVQAEHRDRD